LQPEGFPFSSPHFPRRNASVGANRTLFDDLAKKPVDFVPDHGASDRYVTRAIDRAVPRRTGKRKIQGTSGVRQTGERDRIAAHDCVPSIRNVLAKAGAHRMPLNSPLL